MKRLLKIILGLAFLYVLFWGSVAVYFSYAENYKDKVETKLAEVFKRPVTIASLKTGWQGVSPVIELHNLTVEGDISGQPAFALTTLSATLDPISVLQLWPSFSQFEVVEPLLEVVTLNDEEPQIAGIKLNRKGSDKKLTQRLMVWLLDQQAASWRDGQIVWRRSAQDIQRFTNISMSYKRSQQYRKLETQVLTPKGLLAFIAKSNGDLMKESNWDASLEVLGNEGARLIEPDDFSLSVDEGQGKLLLKTVDVSSVRDFIKLSGLVSNQGWLFDAQLNGRLHDVNLNFSGPFLDMESWSLNAAASDIGFDTVGRAPAMNNLSGELNASAQGGKFIFATQDSEFKWARWYEKGFPIDQARGEFSWTLATDGGATVTLANGEFEDENAKISNINAKFILNPSVRRVSSFGQLFKVESVADLRFDGGNLVDVQDSERRQAPIYLDATAEFGVTDLSKLIGYLPKGEKLDKFRQWAKDAFVQGEATNGFASYKGEATIDAIKMGTANLEAMTDFDNVIVDYAPKFNWPAAKKGRGVARIKNDLLSIEPSQIWLNGDSVTSGLLEISSLFEKTRQLSLQGQTSTSLIKGVDFIFKGPLIKPENQLAELPIVPKEGSVDIDIEVEIPLRKVADARVRGTASIRKGKGVLPSDVLVSDISADVNFTEQSVTSDNIRATFLGGKTKGKLETLKEAQPPVMRLSATGDAHTDKLSNWVGEHLLTWFDGVAAWEGAVLIDGSEVEITGTSDLKGVLVTAPAPLAKSSEETAKLKFQMNVGSKDSQQSMMINYRDLMQLRSKANKPLNDDGPPPFLFDNALISVGSDSAAPLKSGVNFLIEEDSVDLDEWLQAVIELATFEPKVKTDNTAFLDAMRSINISSKNSVLFGRPMGSLNIDAVSVDGLFWIGTLDGENIDGTLQLQPRDELGHYGFKLDYLNLVEQLDSDEPITPIDYTLRPSDFPSLSVDIESLRLDGKNLGKLSFAAKPKDTVWSIDKFDLLRNGTKTVISGGWKNNEADGSISEFEFTTKIDEAEGALNDMDFDGLIRKGKGDITGKLSWIGAPHEFEYARLNGEFEAFLKDGELVKVEPGGGKLLGLLNFNAIARRLVFDFRDVFASGLIFDRMRYSAVLADGEVILREAFILSPAVFVRMEGKVDLDKELVDMEVHISPELGGNLTLLSALANPTAGAVVFLTQRLFKDEMRNSSFKSYRALGTWEDFEMVEMRDGVNSNDAKSDKISTDADLKGVKTESKLEEITPVIKEKRLLDLEKIEASPIP